MKPIIRCSFCNHSTHSRKEVFKPDLRMPVVCCDRCFNNMLKPKVKAIKKMRWF